MASKTFWIIILIFLFFVGWYTYVQVTPGKYDNFAKCLEEKGALFYGAWWCSHCNTQKKMFGKSAKHLPYIECMVGRTREMNEICKKENIQGFPTWTFKDSERKEGELALEYLAVKTGCDMNTGEV